MHATTMCILCGAVCVCEWAPQNESNEWNRPKCAACDSKRKHAMRHHEAEKKENIGVTCKLQEMLHTKTILAQPWHMGYMSDAHCIDAHQTAYCFLLVFSLSLSFLIYGLI